MFLNIYTELHHKDWETYWFQAFKEISDELVTKLFMQTFQRPHMTKSIDSIELVQKGHYTNSNNNNNNPREGVDSDFQNCLIILTEKYERCKDRRKYGPWTGKKQSIMEYRH